jgi:hypothetical protein
MTRQHGGTWARHRTPQEIIDNGKALMEGPFDALSHKDFTAYVRETYGVTYQIALHWMRVARRFDGKDLPGDLPEATLRMLGVALMTEEDAWLILDAIKAKRIPVQYRTVQEIVRHLCGPSLGVSEEVRAFLRGEAKMPNHEAIELIRLREEAETQALEAELRAARQR